MLCTASLGNRGELSDDGCGSARSLANRTHRSNALVRENVVPTIFAGGPNHCHQRISKTKLSKPGNTARHPEYSASPAPASPAEQRADEVRDPCLPPAPRTSSWRNALGRGHAAYGSAGVDPRRIAVGRLDAPPRTNAVTISVLAERGTFAHPRRQRARRGPFRPDSGVSGGGRSGACSSSRATRGTTCSRSSGSAGSFHARVSTGRCPTRSRWKTRSTSGPSCRGGDRGRAIWTVRRGLVRMPGPGSWIRAKERPRGLGRRIQVRCGEEERATVRHPGSFDLRRGRGRRQDRLASVARTTEHTRSLPPGPRTPKTGEKRWAVPIS